MHAHRNMTCLNLVCCLPAFGTRNKCQVASSRLAAYLHVSVIMQPPPVPLNPGFPSRILSRSFGENLQVVRDKIRDGKLGFEATLQLKASCQNQSVLKKSG